MFQLGSRITNDRNLKSQVLKRALSPRTNVFTCDVNKLGHQSRISSRLCRFFMQAAADYVKAHLPESLKQQLQAYEREKKDSPLSYPSILEQRILAVDRDMVEKFSASHDEAGKQTWLCMWWCVSGLG